MNKQNLLKAASHTKPTQPLDRMTAHYSQPTVIHGAITEDTKNQTRFPSPQNVQQDSIHYPIFNESVAIIISGRNSEKYLEEAIRSALAQTVPCEVIYSDDCSTDSSVDIANRYIDRELRVVAHGVHTGVCDTRNRGALVSKAPYLIFMDSDDHLPENYVSDMLSDLKPGTPFVYPNTRPYGVDQEMIEAGVPVGTMWKNRVWSQYDMWVQNQVSTTAMWSRVAFMAAGMWDGNLPTMWDYDLAIKCSRYGLPIAGKAVLDYRIHPSSVSSELNERSPDSAIPHQTSIRRRNASLGVGCLCSGRCPELFPLWLDKLAMSVKYHNRELLHHQTPKPKLLLLLHNNAIKHLSEWQTLAQKYSDTFLSVEFQHHQTEPIPQKANEDFFTAQQMMMTEQNRRVAVSTLLASACQRIQDHLRTDLVWLVEDDIVVPMTGCETLFNYCTSGRNPPIGVSGRYYSRHPGCYHQIGGWIKNGKHEEPIPSFRSVDPVDFVGTGCLMYWPNRPASPSSWHPFTRTYEPGATAHDWAWSEDVAAKGGDLLVLGQVDCRHHVSLQEYV